MTTAVEEKMKVCETLDVAKDWDQWKDTLKDAVQKAKSAHIPDTVIENLAVRVGDFLSNRVCPETKEEELLREMWDLADKNERKALARIMFKMVR